MSQNLKQKFIEDKKNSNTSFLKKKTATTKRVSIFACTTHTNKMHDPNSYPQVFDKFVNILMVDGKKSKAFTILWTALVHTKNILQSQGHIYKVFQSITKSPFTVDSEKKMKVSNHSMIDSHSESNIVVQNFADYSRLLNTAIENITPSLEIKNVRIGGRTYQVPAILAKPRQQTIAFRWIIDSAKKKKRKTKNDFAECLALELVDAYKKQGYARQKRDELHKLAEANRAYIRYRWW